MDALLVFAIGAWYVAASVFAERTNPFTAARAKWQAEDAERLRDLKQTQR